MNRMTLFTRSQLVRQWLPATLGVVGALALGACGGAPSTESTMATTDTATGDTTLVVATEPAFPPFESQASDGSLKGFDIDLMNAIGEAAGFTVEFESLPFDGIIPALQAGTIDAAISAMTITPERAETVSFSRPYFKAGLAIAVQDSTTDVTSLESLEGKRIAAQIGTTGASKANEIPGAEVRTFDSAPLALQELSNGNVDAVINDAPVTLYAIKEGGLTGLKVTGELLTEEFYGIAIPKDSENVALINEGLTTIIEDGTYAEIYQKWFGEAPPDLPEQAPGF